MSQTKETQFPRAKPYKLTVLEIKALVRHRDGYRCVKCGMTAKQHHKRYGRTLDVHRLVPGSKYAVNGCVTICRPCHGCEPRSPRGSGNSCYHAIYVSPDLYNAMKELAKENERPFMWEMRLAVIAWLKRHGHWPPKEQQ